ISERKALSNSSVDFVKTIGRLYFQQKDNRNLAAKMTTHFLGNVRNRFQVPTGRVDETFESRLSYKSGYPPEKIKEIVRLIRLTESGEAVADEDLLTLHDRIDDFYKNT